MPIGRQEPAARVTPRSDFAAEIDDALLQEHTLSLAEVWARLARTIEAVMREVDLKASGPSRRQKIKPLKPGDEAPPGTPGTGENVCPDCKGTGKIDGETCPNCWGTGKIVEGIGGG